MDNQTISLWIGTIVLGNLVIIWRIIVFLFKAFNEYVNLKNTVKDLKEENGKMRKDLNAAHQKIRDIDG